MINKSRGKGLSYWQKHKKVEPGFELVLKKLMVQIYRLTTEFKQFFTLKTCFKDCLQHQKVDQIRLMSKIKCKDRKRARERPNLSNKFLYDLMNWLRNHKTFLVYLLTN